MEVKMIKFICPWRGGYHEGESWKKGQFEDCLYCKRRMLWNPFENEGNDSGSPINYGMFHDLLADNLNFVSRIIKNDFDVCIRHRWVDNNMLEFYAFKIQHPEVQYDCTLVLQMINERESTQREIYRKWMALHR
jgi:hypothetical protein